MDNKAYKKAKECGTLSSISHKPDCDDENCERASHYSLRGWRWDRGLGQWVEK